ncbi:hypothetical protein MmiHf6_14880 [Methanimicrococcus hongohii]|uniref:Uncharacterized protein n=1 Tax=Methanimicrococcus hongohii TaxID=3028295 RepID=A0AA96V0J3_9EURY|nr:hypothetical protein [Methanimicrococcus sp. Hf6]WNY24159.1 hypothetical protein MmiHf6_14880 [Methanimicrococcus sp. Hf6]
MRFKFINILCILFLLISFIGVTTAVEEFTSDSVIEYNSRFTEEYEALSNEEKEQIRDRENKFFEKYTFNVTTTTVVHSSATFEKSGVAYQNVTVETIYKSNDGKFEKEFGTNTVSSSESYTVKEDVDEFFFENQMFSLKSLNENEIVVTETEQIILVPASTPHEWWNDGYAYPPYLYKKRILGVFGDYTEREDPVNLIWKNTNANTVRSTLISRSGWVALNDGLLSEYPYAVYDRNRQWVTPLSVGETQQRRNGGYHVRIYQLSDGSVVGGAHEDSAILSDYGITHKVVNLEYAEYVVCNYFYNAGWRVQQNSQRLNNSGTFGAGATNNGNATVITR